MRPVGFLNNSKFAMLTNKNADKVGLYTFNIETRELEDLMYEHPDYDLTGARLSDDGELLAVEFIQAGLPQVEWIHSYSKEIAQRFKRSIDNGIASIISANAQTDVLLVYTSGPNNPGEYYLFDQQDDTLQPLVSRYPQLQDASFPAHKVFKITSPDGVEIEAFLTLPTSLNHNTLLVMPHGGPIGTRDYNFFDPEIQYLANRGFSILRVNFRGSSGYGKIFQDQGRSQFGQQIEADISLVVNHVIKDKAFDNMCAMGASYGAYSSFMLALKHPELYSCIIASYGVYDLPLLFNVSNYRSGEEFEAAVSKVVGENSGDKKDLSPFYQAANVTVPVLLIAGKKDDVAEFEQSNRMRYVLEKLGKNVETLFFKNVAHGQSSFYGKQQESAYIVEFLLNTLGLSRPNVSILPAQDKAALKHDYSVIGRNFGFSKLLNIDPEIETRKAIKYYQLASEYGDGNASFNLATYYQTGKHFDKNEAKAFALYELSAQQDYPSAHKRLGKLYMGWGNKVVNSRRALYHLLKVVELEDSVLLKLDLARLYCIADASERDIEKCTQMFAELEPQSNTAVTEERFFDNISQAIVYGHFTSKQRQDFSKMAIKTLGIKHPEFEVDISYDGYWYYEENEKFGRFGKQRQADFTSTEEALAANKGDVSIGLDFVMDHKGLSKKTEFVFAIIVMEEFDLAGARVEYRSNFFKQSGRYDITQRFGLDKHTLGHKYVVSLYDIKGSLKYRREYQ
jgi:pimeloyl-ACP methyl ester carboxylesterase